MSSNMKDNGSTSFPRLRFPSFRNAGSWKQSTVKEIIATVTPPKKLQTSDYETEGAFPIIDQSPSYICGWTNDREAVIGKELPVIVFGDHTCVLKFVERPFVQGADGIKIIRPKCEIDARFLFFTLEANPVKQESYKRHFSILKERKLCFPDPSSGEQQKIADCLASADALIEAQGRKVEALRAHKKGLMQQLFPQKGETQPRFRFPEFERAREWAEIPLSKLVSGLNAGVSVNSGDRPAMNNEIGVLKTSAVTSGIFEPLENKVVFDDEEIRRVKEPVHADTIIISRMNTPALVGASAYVKDSLPNIFLPDRLWAAKSRRGTSMRFLAFILGSDRGRATLSSLAGGSSGSMKNIAKPDVLAILLTVPPPPEQQRIADCLTSLDDLIAAETRKQDTLKTHKKGLMQQLFPQVGEGDA